MKYTAEQFQLIKTPVKKSPRLLWLEKYGVTIEHYPKVNPDDEDEFGKLFSYIARTKTGYDAGGNTEQEAIKNLAVKCGWKLWNEL